MKIKEMPDDSRPREKLMKLGPENLASAELLAIIFGIGTPGENVVDMSNRLINEYGLDKLNECSLKELQKIKGIGKAKACQLQSLFEFNKRHITSKKPVKKINCAEDVFDYFHERLKDKKEEHFYVLILNTQNYIIDEQLVSKGILDASIIHPREVFRPAIKNSASKIVLVHNHPSGDPTPSQEDLEITKKLIDIGEGLGIKVVDSVVLGGGKWESLEEK